MEARETTAPSDNRAVNFAPIVGLWESRRPGPGLLPARQNFDMPDFGPWIGWVSIYQIEYGAPIRFKIRLAGVQVTMIERADNTGRFLDEVFPPAEFPDVHAPYFEALETRLPVTLERRVPTKFGVEKTLSKLVLPVADDGRRSDRFINILHYSDIGDLYERDAPIAI